MTTFTGKTALITGASSGIGKSFARILASQKTNLVLVARREDRLQTIADQLIEEFGIEAHVIAQDLAAPKAAETLYKRTHDLGLSIDILLNNAGLGHHGMFLDTDAEGHENTLQVNINALTQLTHLFGQDMKQRGEGYILLVASIASFMPIPQFSTYAASKAYVLSFGQSIAKELKKHNIKVSVTCPGGTATEFMDMSGQNITGWRTRAIMSSDDVAQSGLNALERGKVVNVPGALYKFSAASVRFLPKKLQLIVGEMATK